MTDDASDADEERGDGPPDDGTAPGEGVTAGDPFDRLADAERDGDPFERLGVEDDGADGSPSEIDEGASGDQAVEEDPWVQPGTDQRDDADEWRGPGTDDATASVDGPIEEAETGIGGPTRDDESAAASDEPATGTSEGSATTTPDHDPFGDLDTPDQSPFEERGGVFERVDVGPAEPDDVWESIAEGGEDGDDAEPEVPEEGRYSEVSKHRFCENCEYFSEPPDVACQHETAEIIEFLDMETVRVRDCPVVAEHEALERRE